MSRDNQLPAWCPDATSSLPPPSVKVSPFHWLPGVHCALELPHWLFLWLYANCLRSVGSYADSTSPADIVQDLYVKELKAYKVPATKAGDADAHVQKFNAPAPPKSPEEADIANELKSYEASTVDIEGQAEGGAAEKEVDWFEEEPEEEAHH